MVVEYEALEVYTSLFARKCCIILAVEDNESVDDKLQIYRRCDNTVEPVCYGHLGTIQKCPDYQGVLIFQVSLHHLGPQLGVWIMEVSTFSITYRTYSELHLTHVCVILS